MKKAPWVFIPALALLPVWSGAQTYIMNGAAVTDCSGTFFDSGGAAGDYSNQENLTTTICSDGSGGTHIQLDFSGVALAPGDVLCFYDGPNTAAPLLACSDNYPPGAPFVVQATAANSGGCLTVAFNSDGTGTAAGWAAVIRCVASCQTVLADVVSTSPATQPADTGWIDVCPGKRIFFSGKGIYPQNNLKYQQSDQTTQFEWNFGDGSIAYGPSVSHRFEQAGGYFVQLFLTDTAGCRSTNLINRRVRVAPRPSFNLTSALDNAICAGDTVQLSAAVDTATGKTLLVLPNTADFSSGGSRSDSLALPDGTGVPYETSIYFTEFSPGQVLTDPNDLENICVNMEHSWMRDMEIQLTCPNGQSIVLHDFGGQTGSQVFLGVPNDNDGFSPIPGTGFDYCWTNNAPNPTWLQFANATMPGGGTLPAGTYSPADPFSDLIGCPLNGQWTITVLDLWPIDNGFIFSWSIQFDDQLYPNIETFSPDLVSWNWNNHPSIFFTTPDSIAAAPQNAGTAGYTFTVQDAFGCAWDTLVQLSVLPFTHPDCYRCTPNFAVPPDTALCVGTPVELNAAFLGPVTQEVRFESYPGYRIGNGNHPHNNPYRAPLAVNSLGYNLLTNPATQIASVCVDLETDFDADISLYLRAPDGKLLELSTGNGGSGDNYKVTCFSPTATTPIVGSPAPFNGTFRPEGNWTVLNNALVNGNWELLVSDGFGPTQFGRLNWWSIGFNVPQTIAYTWTNPATLSCANCPNPIATPTTATSYVLTATDNFNCQYRDTVTVAISTFFPAPTGLEATALGANFMTWSWNSVGGASGYEVRVNGGAWQAANGGLSHTIAGLSSGDLVDFEVRALGGGPNCPPNSASGSQAFIACTLAASVDSVAPAVCAGTATGSVFISVANAAPPVQFIPDGIGPILMNGAITNFFAAGTHFVIVRDADACRDTVFFTITEPAPIAIDAVATPVVCNGDSTGVVNASASGGAGNFSFAWQGCSGGVIVNAPTVSGLFAGCYAVTATDANGCTTVDSVTVTEPPPFVFNISQTPVSCFGGSDGSATIAASGGTGPYTYQWANAMGPTATGLDAGFHSVTVTDALGCDAVTLAFVLEPPPLIIDSVAVRNVTCAGSANGSATIFPSGGTPGYSFLWNDPGQQVAPQAINLPPGNYSVTVSDAKGCTAVSGATITQPPPLNLQLAGVVAETCAGSCNAQISLTASGGIPGYSVQWSNPALPADSLTVRNLCPGAYTATITDQNGCTQTLTATAPAAVPIAIVLTETPPLCAAQGAGSALATASGGLPPYQYQWSQGATQPIQPGIPCQAAYGVTITDANNCTATATDASFDCPLPLEINAITVQPALCFGQANGQAAVSATGGTGAYTYLWNDPGAQQSAQAVNLLAGNYTVTVTDANGCSVVGQTNVGQPDPLVVSLSVTHVRCFGGADGSATAVSEGGTPQFSYAWNVPGAGAQVQNLPAGPVRVTVTDANGCSATAGPVNVTQPATPVQAGGAQTRAACYGQTNGQAQASASGGNGGPFTYDWSNQQTGPSIGGLAPGLYVVTASDAQGCTDTAHVTIDELDSIRVNIGTVPPSCYGYTNGVAAVNLVEGGAGDGDTLNYQFKWSIPGAPPSITFIGGLAGGVPYQLTVTDLLGCSNVFTVKTDTAEQIKLALARTPATCFGYTDGKAIVTQVLSSFPIAIYQWSANGSGAGATNLAAGTYTVTVTDTRNCTAVQSFVIEQPPPLTLSLQAQPLDCNNDTNGIITAQVQGGTPAYQYSWADGASTALRTNLGAGDYALTVTDNNGCTTDGAITLAQPLPPVIQVEKTPPTCFGDQNGRIRLMVTGGQMPYRYSLDDGPFGGSSTFVGLEAGVFTFRVLDGKGCITTYVDSLPAPPLLEVYLGPDTTILLGDSVLLDPEISNAFGTIDYLWSSMLLEPLPCVDTPECSMILVKPYQTNTYRVEITDEKGCEGVATIKIIVDKPRGIFVPTAFSPNGAPENRRLIVHGKSRTVKNIRVFRIFDRWGELVFEDFNFGVNDFSRGWDGAFRGQPCDPGVFVWYAEVEYLDGYEEVVSGNSTLIR